MPVCTTTDWASRAAGIHKTSLDAAGRGNTTGLLGHKFTRRRFLFHREPQHCSGVADDAAEKTRSTGMTLTIGLARCMGLAIVRLGVDASLRAFVVACRAGRASESTARSSRCTWHEMSEMERDGARWRSEMERWPAWRGVGKAQAWHRRGTGVA